MQKLGDVIDSTTFIEPFVTNTSDTVSLNQHLCFVVFSTDFFSLVKALRHHVCFWEARRVHASSIVISVGNYEVPALKVESKRVLDPVLPQAYLQKLIDFQK